jgi:hypothetical protein
MIKFEVYEITLTLPTIPSYKVCMSVENYNRFLEAVKLNEKEFKWLNPLYVDEYESQRKKEEDGMYVPINETNFRFMTIHLDEPCAFSAEKKTFFKVLPKIKDKA